MEFVFGMSVIGSDGSDAGVLDYVLVAPSTREITHLAVRTPQELEAGGANVYVSPNIRPNTKVVNLANGQVNWFQEGEDRPARGYFAAFDGLVHYARRHGIPLSETNGQVSTQAVGFAEAGDPLRHGGE